MDLPEAYENWPASRGKLQARGIEPFCMSAVHREGTHEVISAVFQILRQNKKAKEFEGWENSENLNHLADMVQKQRSASINEFEISHDKSVNSWHITGSGLQRFVQMTYWRYTV